MGRNLKDFYGKSDETGAGFVRASAQGPNGGAMLSRDGDRISATPDNAESAASRNVTRNRDVKKQGKRLSEVAVGNKKRLKNDGY